MDRISAGNSFGVLKNFRQVDVGLKMLRLVKGDQKYLQRLGLLAVILVVFVLGHEDHEPSLPSIPDSNVGLQRCVHAGFLQNDGAGMLWNGGVQDIWTGPISFAWELLRLLEETVDY